MPGMISYSRRQKSGQITCYLNRTYITCYRHLLKYLLAARSDLGYSPCHPFQPQGNPMMFSTFRAQSLRSELPTSPTHVNMQSAVPGAPPAFISRGRRLPRAVLLLAAIVCLLSPASMQAQYTENVLYSFCHAGGLC